MYSVAGSLRSLVASNSSVTRLARSPLGHAELDVVAVNLLVLERVLLAVVVGREGHAGAEKQGRLYVRPGFVRGANFGKSLERSEIVSIFCLGVG